MRPCATLASFMAPMMPSDQTSTMRTSIPRSCDSFSSRAPRIWFVESAVTLPSMGNTTHLNGSVIPVKYSISASPSCRSEIISPGWCWHTTRQSRLASFILARTAAQRRWISSTDQALGSDSGVIAPGRAPPVEARSPCAPRAQVEPAGVKSDAAMPAEALCSKCLRENAPFSVFCEDFATVHLRTNGLNLYAFYSNCPLASSRSAEARCAVDPWFIQLGYNDVWVLVD